MFSPLLPHLLLLNLGLALSFLFVLHLLLPLVAHPPSSLSHSTFVFLFTLLPVPASVVLFDLLVNILGHNLAEPAYEAEVAQLEYKLVAGEHGLVVKVKGFNHKLPVSKCIMRKDTPTKLLI